LVKAGKMTNLVSQLSDNQSINWISDKHI